MLLLLFYFLMVRPIIFYNFYLKGYWKCLLGLIIGVLIDPCIHHHIIGGLNSCRKKDPHHPCNQKGPNSYLSHHRFLPFSGFVDSIHISMVRV
jgi:hypothetical protein